MVLVFVPPGRRRAITAFLNTTIKDSKIFDIESKLCEKLEHELKQRGIEIEEKMNMNLALSYFTRQHLEKRWKEVINEYAVDIDHATEKNCFLIGHAVYYANIRKEYYSIFDANHILNNLKKITHVVLVTDDIFDLYWQLSGGNKELFGDTALRLFAEDYKRNVDTTLETELDARGYLNWMQFCMSSVLSWRSQEIILVQNISSQLNCDNFILWGLKQNINVLQNWISGSDEKIFYISHPISELRRKRQKLANIELAKVITNIQNKLMPHKTNTVMPTSLDEFRFKKKNTNYTPKLSERWPISKEVKKTLSRNNLLVNDEHCVDFFKPYNLEFQANKTKKKKARPKPHQEYVNGCFSSLEMGIVEQLANRDHLLVWLTDGIIVIEPWSEKYHVIHGGVRKELQYLRDVNRNIRLTPETKRSEKKLVVLISNSSLKNVTKQSKFQDRAHSILTELVSSKHTLDLNDVHSSIDKKTLEMDIHGGPLSNVISTSQLSTIHADLPNLKKEALRATFFYQVLSMNENDAKTVILVADKVKDMLKDKILLKVEKFLIGNQNTDNLEEYLLKAARSTGVKI